MDFKIFVTVFTTVFVAEIADKTQLATILFASDQKNSTWLVFFAAAAALVVASGIAVFAGSLLSNFLDEKIMNRVAGILFIVIGVWTLAKA